MPSHTGIGSNLYLCKIAMDIVAKHIAPDRDGVRIAELDEMSYRRELWDHRPLTDFWRVGKGYAKKLEQRGMYTMGDVARCSVQNEELLYRMFGVNAELLIDHAWGWEPCTMDLVKAYKPETNSFSSGQVLSSPYSFTKARLVAHEMAEAVALDLVDKRMVTDQMVLTVGYDIECLTDPKISRKYKGEVTTDSYGRRTPKLVGAEASAVLRQAEICEQLDLFTDYASLEKKRKAEEEELARERRMQEAMLTIKKKFGKNAVLKGMNLQEGATARDRNDRIGGHKA